MAKQDTTAIGLAAAAGAFAALVAWGDLQASMEPSLPLGLAMVVLSFVLGPLVLLGPVIVAIGVGSCVGFLVYCVARILRYQPQGRDQEAAELVPGSDGGSGEGGRESGDPMKVYGITFDGAKYRFQEFQYDKLEDAIDYASIVSRRGGV